MTPSSFQRNQLINSSSPYLRQHADNPVHWQIWGADVLEEAQRLDKPILLSVGYAACHWCHVMAHESFEDESTAKLMNRYFINIKVDREERPDIDQIYMSALHAMGEQGGWPLTMFLTPDGLPFWGGTYFPPRPAHGRPAFIQILQALERMYRENPETISKNTVAIKKHLDGLSVSPDISANVLDETGLESFIQRTLSIHDKINGGMHGAPKFPNAPFLETWARASNGNPESEAGKAFIKTISKISQGGIYDHLRGGIARYSVDEIWLAPHFEKMLYDNAHYIRHLVIAWQMTGSQLFRNRIEETLAWLEQEMLLSCGAYASSIDADSDGGEGNFYTWTIAEIKKITGSNYKLFGRIYDVKQAGNWEGKTILNRLGSTRQDEKTEALLDKLKILLLKQRNKRTRPGLDDKVLTDWNGYLIRAMAEAGSVMSIPKWLERSKTAFDFIAESNSENGYLNHSWREEICIKPALATDYGAMINAALSLYEASADNSYLEKSKRWFEILQDDYSDSAGGYFLTSLSGSDLVVRPRCDLDEANPSAGSQILEAMIRYSHLTGEKEFLDKAEALAANLQAIAITNPHGMAGFFSALYSWFNHRHILIMAKDMTHAAELVKVARACAIVSKTITTITGTINQKFMGFEIASTKENATAIVCSSRSCSAPVTSAADLFELISAVRKFP